MKSLIQQNLYIEYGSSGVRKGIGLDIIRSYNEPSRLSVPVILFYW